MAFAVAALIAVAFPVTGSAANPEGTGAGETASPSPSPGGQHPHPNIDHSGRKQSGTASYYGKSAKHRKTASGEPLDSGQMTAASKTLPLGTRAKVTNTENGKSAEVTINDRGPYKKGRILDVTPKVADKLGLKPEGAAPVEVKPLAVPQPDGQIKHPDP